MKNVKRTFFITKEEEESLKKITGNNYITAPGPNFELEDGTILYSQWGGPASGETFYKHI